MSRLLEKIALKKVIIWGVGAIQLDMEALFPTIKTAYYVDDRLEEKGGRIPNNYKKRILTPESLLTEQKEDIFILICEQNRDSALGFLDKNGFIKGMHYVSYERILYEFSSNRFAELFLDSETVIWGAGKTFSDYKEYLEQMLNGISFLIDGGERGPEYVEGYKVFAPQEGINNLNGRKVIVTSTYYPVILEELRGYGYLPGKNCLFADTFEILCRYYKLFGHVQYTFEDRRRQSKKMLLVLAGYKQELWGCVFQRIKCFVPVEYDICVASSGCYLKELSQLCRENNWSYLSTQKNKISVIVNIACHEHSSSDWIIKMDEDMFLTENTVSVLENTYQSVSANGRYEVGFVSPLIPVNGYGYSRVLDLLNLTEEWTNTFETIKITDGLHHHKKILENSEAARFLWEKIKIDDISKKLGKKEFRYSICPSRYSIGMILFSRDMWIDMEMFPDIGDNNLGMDERHITEYCMMSGKAMVIAENTVAGHLGYKEQTPELMEYYKNSLQPWSYSSEIDVN